METTMTRNGQITIPKEYREQMGLKEGSRLRYWMENGDLVVRAAKKRPWEVPGESGFTDEIVAMVEKLRAESRWRYP